ncbi:hypothetical protein C2E23DRAFT_73474 [Lenzites betulinus]|nr:hypothetical protein C2E23DRAFT_73474 [Lenzites betulinus]
MSKQPVDAVEEPEYEEGEESDDYDIDDEGESGTLEEEEEEEEEGAKNAQGSNLTALLLGGQNKLPNRTRMTRRMTKSTRKMTASKSRLPLRRAQSVVERMTTGHLARAKSQETTESSRRPKRLSQRGQELLLLPSKPQKMMKRMFKRVSQRHGLWLSMFMFCLSSVSNRRGGAHVLQILTCCNNSFRLYLPPCARRPVVSPMRARFCR